MSLLGLCHLLRDWNYFLKPPPTVHLLQDKGYKNSFGKASPIKRILGQGSWKWESNAPQSFQLLACQGIRTKLVLLKGLNNQSTLMTQVIKNWRGSLVKELERGMKYITIFPGPLGNKSTKKVHKNMKRKIKETGSGYQMHRNPSKSWHMNLAHPFSKVRTTKD